MNDQHPPPSVPPEVYTREYYERCCQGYEEFQKSRGRVLPLRLRIPLRLGALEPGMQVLDVGCGRGELLLHAAQRGAFACGLDYAREAVVIAQETIAGADRAYRDRILGVQQADARRLPYPARTFDRVFLLDIVEHLYPEELHEMLVEVRRVLKEGGFAVIHTMPNTWYYRFGYPLYRLLQRLRGVRLPANPRERWPYHHVHVNEQNPLSLRRALRAAGFSARVWLAPAQRYDYERNPLVRAGMEGVTRLYPFRWIFCNDLFAIARKP
ncbi:MAG: class I SAM-dependent methyltransferase [Chloroflexi bacterium]|nr:MAG: class I SAM-dependent methyltransferase [Chloroflexota bacterium]